MFGVLLLIVGYAWGKLVQRTGSWTGATWEVVRWGQQVTSGIVARFTSAKP